MWKAILKYGIRPKHQNMQGSNPREGFILLFSHSGKMCYIFSLADKLIYKKQGYPSKNKIRLLHRIPIKKISSK